MEYAELIDFELKGNIVRFWLGKNGKQWGDDWNDAPYEHNAGTVYEEFVRGHIDLAFGFEMIVLEPSSGTQNSEWSKEDMIHRRVPCLVVLDSKYVDKRDWNLDDFAHIAANDHAVKFYFGDGAEVLANKIKAIASIL